MFPPIYAHLTFDKGIKIIQWKKETFQRMVLVQLALSMQHKMEQNNPSSSSRQECTLLIQPHVMPARRQSSFP